MRIKCVLSQNVPYEDPDGVLQLCTLQPGEHEYPMLNPSDKVLAATLRVLRKHGAVKFKDLLPSDVDVLKKAPAGVDREKYLAEKTGLAPNPRGRKVAGKKKAGKNVASRPGPADQPVAPAAKAGGGGKKSGPVSDKS